MKLLEHLRAFCVQHGLDKTYWIGYSGGLDSHVLLALCKELRAEVTINLRAIHINHGLSPNAQQWSAHCARVCADYDIAFTERSIAINRDTGESLEAAAREQRYAVLTEYLQPGDILLTAHHQDDQAETVLLQLLRGAGVKGLAAMPAIKSFGAGFHARPLLNCNRDALLEYAKQHALNWIDDESNDNQKFARNYVRHEVMPMLTVRWPAAALTLARSAENCAQAQVLLDEFAKEALHNVAGSRANSLSVSKLLQCSLVRRQLLLRSWIQQSGYPLPDTKKMLTIQDSVLTAAWDRLPQVSWGGVELRRYRDDLYLLARRAELDLQQTYAWDLSCPLVVPNLGTLQARMVKSGGLRADINNVSIQFRRGGEVIDIPGRGRHTLKNMLHEWNILPWERDRIPLLYAAEKLISVTGYFLHADFVSANNEPGWEISLQH